MSHAQLTWEKLILDVDGKEYKIRHNYLELLRILDIKWLFEMRSRFPIWNIKGIGRIKLTYLDFRQETKTLKIHAKMDSVPWREEEENSKALVVFKG